MPYKCSVKGCRSNYDSTKERVPMFQFPADETLRSKWIGSVELNSKLTASSRVCIKHFDSHHIDNTSRRIMLKPNAVPDAEEMFSTIIPSPQEFAIEDSEQVLEIDKLSEQNRNRIDGFASFCSELEQFTENISEHWKIFNHSRGVCFYRLSYNENFNELSISYNIMVNDLMRVKIVKNQIEASSDELKWLLEDCHLQNWTQLKKLLDYYQQEPEVIVKPHKFIACAIKSLENIRPEDDEVSFMMQINSVREQLVLLYDQANLYWPEEEKSFHDEALEIENEVIEALDEEMEYEEEMLEDNQTFEDGPDFQNETKAAELMIHDDLEDFNEPEDPLKCQNCFITFKSANGLLSHKKTCNTRITNVIINTRKLKPLERTDSPKTEPCVCDHCGKTFQSMKSLKEHLKSHDDTFRKKCPYCDLDVFSSVLQRHIQAVHLKVKPHKCSFCKKAFATSTLRNHHEKTHSKNLDLQQHLVLIEDNPRYSCPKCSTHYGSSHFLKLHLETNCRKADKRRPYRYPCQACARTFTKRILAAEHMLTAHQIKIESIEKFCFECNQEFDDYASHARLHSCKFACRFCGSKFLTQKKASLHEEKQHSRETFEDRPFKCEEDNCGLSFKNVSHLKSHQLAIHLKQEKLYKCQHCAKEFGLRANLTVHIRQHFVQFHCNYQDCQRQFKKLNNLKEHFEKIHGMAEMYLCNLGLCSERFKMLKDLKKHREDEHGVAFHINKYFENNSETDK